MYIQEVEQMVNVLKAKIYLSVTYGQLLSEIKKEIDGAPLVQMADFGWYKVLPKGLCDRIEALKL